jgi:hypothetical protein
MRRTAFWPAFPPFLLSLALLANQTASGWADGTRRFILATSDGYGVLDCLAQGGECGHAVADAWCEAHGRRHALSFGPTDDVTGSIASPASTSVERGAYAITCGD